MQLKTSIAIEFFHEIFKKRFNFSEYINSDAPTVFFGIYRKQDIRTILDHTGPRMLWFAGIDAVNDKTLHYIRKYALEGNTTVIAESEWIKRDLERYAIKYKYISMLNGNIDNWKVEPLGESLFWYKAGKTKYGKKIFKHIREAIPDLDIIVVNDNSLSQTEIKELYKKCFACLRPIEHDGQSQTVAEMGLMGRMSIWNGNIPCSISYTDVNDIINKVKKLRLGYDPNIVAQQTREFFLENERKFKELVIETCGQEEADKMFK